MTDQDLKMIVDTKLIPFNETKNRNDLIRSKSFLHTSDVLNEKLLGDCISITYEYINVDPNVHFDEVLPDHILEKLNNLLKDNIDSVLKEVPTMAIKGKGLPDFIVWNKRNIEDIFFIEAKSNNDGLRRSQLEWMSYHDFLDTYICYFEVEKFSRDNIKRYIDDYEENKEG